MQRNRLLSLVLSFSLILQTLLVMPVSAAPGASEVQALAVDSNLKPVALFPQHGSQSVVTSTNLKLTFAEVVLTGSGIITLRKVEDPAYQLNIDITNPALVQLDDAGKSIVIKPGSLTAGNYNVTIPSSAIRSYATTNDFAGIAPSEWTFQVQDLTPVVTNYSPTNGLTTVDPVAQTSLSLVFSRDVASGSGFIQVKRVADNVTVHTIAASELTIAGAVVSAPLRGIDYNTQYYILLDPGVIRDANNGGDFAGIAAMGWTFTTKPALDTTKPKIAEFSPANNGVLNDLTTGILKLKFDEKVFANTSKGIVVRNASTNTVLCTVQAENTVGSAGNDQIQINWTSSLCPALQNNADYSLTIGPDVYRDASGNYFDGVVWKFKALIDTTPPAISAYAPAVNAVNVSIASKDFALTFNKPIVAFTGSPKAYLFPQNSQSNRRELTMTIDPADNKRVLFKLTGTAGLSNSTTYAITVPDGVIKDALGNTFAGIANANQWIFQTGTNSKPVINNATIDGATIILTYSEILDSSKVPAASNFYVTVNDTVTPVIGVAVSGADVRVTLQYTVLVGQTVRVSYYRDSSIASRRLQNMGGVEADAFSNRVLSNQTESALAKPISGNYYSGSLMLTFNKSLPALAAGAQSQFVIKQNDATLGISNAVMNGTMLYLTLSSNSTNPQPVSISYTPGANPLRDQSGSLVPAFTDFYVKNPYDNVAPTLSSATLNGNKLILTYNEGLNTLSVPPKNSFSITPSGTNTTLPSITNVAVVNNTIELTLSSNVAANIQVLLYYHPSSPVITDLAGNAAAAILAQSITSGSSTVAQLSTLTAANNQIALNYSTNLSATSVPYITQYTAKYDGIAVPVTAVSISGAQVILTLSSAPQTGQRVTLSYNLSGITVKDYLNQPVAAFTELAVTNNGGGLPGSGNTNMPDYLESDGAGGARLIVAKTATVVAAATPSGRTANRYMINGDKLLAAFEFIRQGNGITSPVLTFKVPASEAGALVGIPVRVLVDSASRASNASFRLDFGDTQFTLPLKAINYNKELQTAGGDISSAYILLNIEKVSNSPLSSAVAGKGAQLLATPADFSASLLAAGREKVIDNYELFVTRTFIVTSTNGASKEQISVVRLDTDSGEVSYVPTEIQPLANGTNIHFKRKGNSLYAVIRNNSQFSDMTKHWANNDVSLLASKFIVRGSSLTAFSPSRAITRAEFAEYIARGLGLTGASSSAAKFKDVGAGYRTASFIGAVSDAGIVEGGKDGRFRPEASITREEMATMLVRAMKYAGVQTTATSTALNEFKDRSKVSSWAKEGMLTSVTAGFIQGTNKKLINPQSNATRAEAAIMLKRFLEYVEFL